MAEHFDADVLVLGAGVAGLAAAANLSGSHRVLVLEARDRIGGRILTHRVVDDPLPIDLGPEFIHGRPRETFELLDEAKLVPYELSFNQFEAGKGKPRLADGVWDGVDALLARLPKIEPRSRVGRTARGNKRKAAAPADESFTGFLNRHKHIDAATRRRAWEYVEGFNAADADRISVQSIVLSNAEEDATDGERQHRLIGGYDQLAAALAARLARPSRIELHTVARVVQWSRGRVRVETDTPSGRQMFTARQLIVALPLGVLQQPSEATAGVRFDPPLPVEPVLRDALVMGDVHKITLTCRTAFWESAGSLDLSFLHAPNAPIPVWWTSHPLRTRRITGWLGGSRATAICGDTDTMLKLAVQSLASVFHWAPSRIADQIVAIHAHDWRRDPFSCGAYSYVAVGGVGPAARLSRGIERTVFFAGEHTHRGLIGTVAGAIQSGQHAARLLATASRQRS